MPEKSKTGLDDKYDLIVKLLTILFNYEEIHKNLDISLLVQTIAGHIEAYHIEAMLYVPRQNN